MHFDSTPAKLSSPFCPNLICPSCPNGIGFEIEVTQRWAVRQHSGKTLFPYCFNIIFSII
jgi:hypothetical protein